MQTLERPDTADFTQPPKSAGYIQNKGDFLSIVRIGLKKYRFAFQRLLHVVHEEQAQFPDAEVGVDAHAEPAAVRLVAVVIRRGSVRPPAVAASGEDDRVGEHELDGAVQGRLSGVSRVNIKIRLMLHTLRERVEALEVVKNAKQISFRLLQFGLGLENDLEHGDFPLKPHH